LLSMPNSSFRALHNFGLHTLSYAFSMSTNTTARSSLIALLFSIANCTNRTLSSRRYPLRKPLCPSARHFLSLLSSSMRRSRSHAYTFASCGLIDIGRQFAGSDYAPFPLYIEVSCTSFHFGGIPFSRKRLNNLVSASTTSG
jgi:hypothetical protein